MIKNQRIMSNFFSFYDLEPAFLLDESLLRRKFLELSRTYHPDFFGEASDEKQAEVLELSSKNNEAFKVLSDFDRRFAYILNMHGMLDEQKNRNSLPQSFLFEMMEFNERLSELESNFSKAEFDKLENEINHTQNILYKHVEPDLSEYNHKTANEQLLERLLDYYLKKKYLNRLSERLLAFEHGKQ